MDREGNLLDNEYQLALVRVGPQHYAIDIMKIREIIRPIKITSIHNSLPYLAGVINLRGEVIPVVDMRVRIGVSPEAGPSQRIVIVEMDGKRVGMMVDEASEVIRVTGRDIKPPPRITEGVDPRFFLGVCQYQNELYMIFDLNKILTSRDRVRIL